MSLFNTNHIFDTGTSERLDKHKGVQTEAEQAQMTPNEHERGQTSMNENKWKSNERDQAVGTNTKHKQPQASKQPSGNERGGMNVSKGRSGVSGGGCGDEQVREMGRWRQRKIPVF